MPDITTLSLFLAAAFALSITPGPGILYTLARTVHGGKREGMASILGLFVGGGVHVMAAAVGISGVLMTSAIAFISVKYVGAAYLIYLGLRTLLQRDSVGAVVNAVEPSRRLINVFYQGVITETLNPKTALFFLAFIPQFINVANGHVFAQFLTLGLFTIWLNLMADTGVVLFADAIAQRLRTQLRQGQRIVSGCTLIGLGTYVAVAEPS